MQSDIKPPRSIRDIEMDIDLRRKAWEQDAVLANQLLAELEAAGGGRKRMTRNQRRALHAQAARDAKRTQHGH